MLVETSKYSINLMRVHDPVAVSSIISAVDLRSRSSAVSPSK